MQAKADMADMLADALRCLLRTITEQRHKDAPVNMAILVTARYYQPLIDEYDLIAGPVMVLDAESKRQ